MFMLNFPINPTNGQLYTSGIRSWTFDGSGWNLNDGDGIRSSYRLPSVTDAPYNAAKDGATDVTAAFQAAYNAQPEGGTLLVPPGNYVLGTLTGTKRINWITTGAFYSNGVTPLRGLPGISNNFYEGRKGFFDDKPLALGGHSIIINREATYTGIPGAVNGALSVQTTAKASSTGAFEWSLLARLNNEAIGSQNNVAIYGQNFSTADGANWAGCFEMRNTTGIANPTQANIGIEVDVFANGDDTNNNRVAIDVVGGRGIPGGVRPTINAGVRVGPTNGNANEAYFKFGFRVSGDANIGLSTENNNGTFGISDTGSKAVGMQLGGTYTNAAIRIPANSKISLTVDDARALFWNNGFQLSVNNVTKHTFQDNGDYQLAGKINFSSAITTTTAAGGSITLPSLAVGYISVMIDGSIKKIPYYG